MKIYAKCIQCEAPVRLKGRFNDRREIIREVGETVNLTCGECHQNQDVMVGSLKAEQNRWGEATFYLSSILVTLAIFWGLMKYVLSHDLGLVNYDVVVIATIPSFVYVIYSHQERNRVRRFNGYL